MIGLVVIYLVGVWFVLGELKSTKNRWGYALAWPLLGLVIVLELVVKEAKRGRPEDSDERGDR